MGRIKSQYQCYTKGDQTSVSAVVSWDINLENVRIQRAIQKDLAFGPWLKASILLDRFKQNRSQERGN